MSECGPPELCGGGEHDDPLSSFHHVPDDAGFPYITASKAALFRYAPDADKREIGVKGVCPAALNVWEFDWAERGEGPHPKLSAEDVELGDGVGRDVPGKVQIVRHDRQVFFALESTGQGQSGRTAIHQQGLPVGNQGRGK